MDMTKIVNLTDDELRTQTAQASEQIFRIRFQKTLGNVEGLKKLSGLKLDVARMKTIERQRSLAAKATPEPKASAPAPSQRTARKMKRKANA